jgi:hypothetical protein
VFFRGPEGRFLYVNGLMHLLKYSSVERAGKNLLRGRSRLRDTDVRLPWRDRCATPLEVPEACSDTFRMVAGHRPPICLLTYPRLPSLDPRDPSFHEKIAAVIREAWSFSCPFQGGHRQHDEALMEDSTPNAAFRGPAYCALVQPAFLASFILSPKANFLNSKFSLRPSAYLGVLCVIKPVKRRVRRDTQRTAEKTSNQDTT